MKPAIVYFAREYQAELFPQLHSSRYDSILVAYNKKEKKRIEKSGVKCHECFEESFNDLCIEDLPDKYLETSLSSDRYFGKWPLEKRIFILKKYIAFWKRIFDKYSPVAVVNEVIAIEISEVMYIEAKKRNIAYFAWLVSPFYEKQFYWLNNPFHASLNEEIFLRTPKSESVEKVNNYIENLKDSTKGQPFYIQNIKKRNRIDTMINLLIYYLRIRIYYLFNNENKSIFYFDNSEYAISRLKSYINSYYRKYDNIDSYKNYELVFYPLHYEPEASLTYFAEFYDDQINSIKNITKCLKHNQILIVKEHPQQPGILLTKSFRDLRKSYSNVIYLPAEYPTRKLLNSISLVITISSTAGWEAIMLNKPVFVLGKVFYDKYSGINNVSYFEVLKNQIRNNNFKYPDSNETLKYAANFFEYCQEGNPFYHPNLYSRDNLTKLRNAIERKIEDLISPK